MQDIRSVSHESGLHSLITTQFQEAAHCCFKWTLSLSCFFQSDRFQPGVPADFYRSKAQTSAQRSSPSGFSSLSSFLPAQKQRPPADQLLTTQAERDLLLGALRQYLSGHLSLYRGGMNPDEQEAPSSRLRPFYSNGIENPGLKKETSKSRLLKMGRTQGASVKDPLTSVDGMSFNV